MYLERSTNLLKRNVMNEWLDVYLGKYKWYRKIRKGIWYKHQFTKDAEQITLPYLGTFWAKYGKINRYSNIIEIESY